MKGYKHDSLSVVYETLHRPFPPEDLEWRALRSGGSAEKPWVIIAPYVTSRAVMARMDEAFGFENWSASFVESVVDSGFICTIEATVYHPETGDFLVTIRKSDGAGKSDIEPFKGGISDALKRAAVLFGIGRYLYDFKKPIYGVICPREESIAMGKVDNKSFFWKLPREYSSSTEVEEKNVAPKGNLAPALEVIGRCKTMQELTDTRAALNMRSWTEDEVEKLRFAVNAQTDKFIGGVCCMNDQYRLVNLLRPCSSRMSFTRRQLRA